MYSPADRRNGEQFADAVMIRRELTGQEPEVAVTLAWTIGVHVHDPHDWDEISTVVDLLEWLAAGAQAKAPDGAPWYAHLDGPCGPSCSTP